MLQVRIEGSNTSIFTVSVSVEQILQQNTKRWIVISNYVFSEATCSCPGFLWADGCLS